MNDEKMVPLMVSPPPSERLLLDRRKVAALEAIAKSLYLISQGRSQ